MHCSVSSLTPRLLRTGVLISNFSGWPLATQAAVHRILSWHATVLCAIHKTGCTARSSPPHCPGRAQGILTSALLQQPYAANAAVEKNPKAMMHQHQAQYGKQDAVFQSGHSKILSSSTAGQYNSQSPPSSPLGAPLQLTVMNPLVTVTTDLLPCFWQCF